MYKLKWPDKIDKELIFNELCIYFNVTRDIINNLWYEYLDIHTQHNHKKLGEYKTLNTEETFIIFIIMKLYKLETIVEIGTLLGKSTRRIIDIKTTLKQNILIKCYDIVNSVQYFKPSEAQLILKDITNSIKKDVIDNYKTPTLIYLDAHPYDITKNVILETLQSDNHFLIIHDCGEILCNPQMTISRNDPITSITGHWERYVLADVFGLSNPLDKLLNIQETQRHKMRVFSTLHGLCAIIPKQ